MSKVLKLDAVRGALIGLGGTGAGMGVTMLIRNALGVPAWDQFQVFTIGIITGVIAYVLGLGTLNYWLRWMIGARQEEEYGPPDSTWRRYFNVDLNHKVIGVQYAVTALFFLPFAIALQIVGRLHITNVAPGILNADTYQWVISDHAVVMLFIVVLPAFSGLMNYLVPLMIGARDLAFPRLNAFSFWLVPASGLLVTFTLAAGGFDTGWTAYPPLSSQFQPLGMNLILLGVYLSGLSSIMTAVNMLVTMGKMRASGMHPFRMPIFVWSAFATVGLTLVFTQFIAMAFIMVLLERMLGMGFFDPSLGGNVILYQHLFWFYSHPAVYIFMLLGMGTISEIVPVFSRKPLFGYAAVALASPGIAIGGSFVWGHHMFAAGMEAFLRIPFMITTLLVAVPTGVKIFAWLATMWLGKLRLKIPFLFVLSAMFIFLIGGLTGVPLGIVPVDLYFQDTYFVVGHFHATLFGGFLLPFMAALYYWFPKVSGKMLNEKLGMIQWLLMTLGALALILPMLGLGLEGMRRRVDAFDPTVITPGLHMSTLVAAFLVIAGVIVMIANIVRSLRHGETAGQNPWESKTLEWQVSSPPPEDNFEGNPEIVGRPYGYGIPDAVHAVVRDSDEK